MPNKNWMRNNTLRGEIMKKLQFYTVCMLSLILLLSSSAMAANAYHGNAASKIYHNFTCRYFNCNKCTVIFSSAEEARAKGFRPCKVCGG